MTWSSESGLFLFLNGAEPVTTQVTTSVNNHDRSNRIVIGRSNAQDPSSTFAELSTRIFVLFDMFVTKSEATDIYVYFWGHGKCSIILFTFIFLRFFIGCKDRYGVKKLLLGQRTTFFCIQIEHTLGKFNFFHSGFAHTRL